MKPILLNQVFKTYPNGVEALKGISFETDAESFTAFLGKNGAGKSTTINMISTLLYPSSGTVVVNGHQLGSDDARIRDNIGTVFQNGVLDAKLSVYENLLVRGSLYRLPTHILRQRVDELLITFGLSDLKSQRYHALSGGQKRKVDIARAMINQPSILILDEPTTGLDPKSRKDLWAFIHQLRKSHRMSVLLTTHYLDEVMDADRIVVIHQGRLIENDTSVALRQKYTQTRCILTLRAPLPEATLSTCTLIQKLDHRLELGFDNSMKALDFINAHAHHIEQFEVLKGSLDDVFLRLTEGTSDVVATD
jgi:ABC-type multidrug transport system ATPase subunit